jgi:hypothetical protein
MQAPDDSTGKDLRERIAVWAIAEKNRLRRTRELRKIIDQPETPVRIPHSSIVFSAAPETVRYAGEKTS